MHDRRRSDRRKSARNARDRRRPSLVETIRGDQNVWKHDPGDKLLADLDLLDLRIEGEDDKAGADDGNPYNHVGNPRRK